MRTMLRMASFIVMLSLSHEQSVSPQASFMMLPAAMVCFSTSALAKTEAVVSLRGSGAVGLRRQLAVDGGIATERFILRVVCA